MIKVKYKGARTITKQKYAFDKRKAARWRKRHPLKAAAMELEIAALEAIWDIEDYEERD